MKGETCAHDRDLFAELASDESTAAYRAYYLAHSQVCAMIATAIAIVSSALADEEDLRFAIALVKRYDNAIEAQDIRTNSRDESFWATEEMMELTFDLERIIKNLA